MPDKLRAFYAGHTALITGGTSGIGLACAVELAKLGAHVCLISRKPTNIKTALHAVRAAANDPAQKFAGFAADVGSFQSVKNAVRRCRDTIGAPDILIHSAGFSRPGYFETQPLQLFYKQTRTNYFGAVHAAKAVTPGMISRGQGIIVNVASVAGFLGVFGFSSYCPTKFAVLGFSECLRQELGPRGIRVHVACPPDTDTPGFQRENREKPAETKALSETAKLESAETVARSILRGVAREKYLILSNFESRAIYFLSRVVPGTSRRVMDYMVRKARKSGT